MKLRLSVCILLLAPSLCVAQERAESHRSAPAIVVNGEQVSAGPFWSMLEAFSKAFDPGQHNVRWPLYAYDVTPLGLEFCREHAPELSASGAAFVGHVSSGLIDASPRYMGIQITDTAWFLDTCRRLIERQDDFEQVLDDYLDGIEGFGEYLHDGRLQRIDSASIPDGVSYNRDDACVRRVRFGTLDSGAQGNVATFGNADSGMHGGLLRWTGRVDNAQQGPVRLNWGAAADSARSINEMIRSLADGTPTWQFTPRDPGQFGGRFLITYNHDASSTMQSGGGISGTSLWNGEGIEWEEMSGDADYWNGNFDMWYLPPFCGANSDEPWYLVSRYRLGFDRDLGFRARLAPLRPAAVAAVHQQ